MTTATQPQATRPPVVETAATNPERVRPRTWSDRVRCYFILSKPRIVVMVLVTVAVGYLLGAHGSTRPLTLALTLIGTGLVSAGASVWNQYLERVRDGLMRRTARRPLPTGAVAPTEAVIFGSTMGIVGLLILGIGAHPLAALVAFITFVLYSFAYTLMKPRSTLNTAIGAIPGALPPVIGWAAASGQVGAEAMSLFVIMFLWQFPHFLSIAWLYRDDYARAGHRMLPSVDPTGAMTSRQAVWYCLLLLPAGVAPTLLGMSSSLAALGALGLGLWYLSHALRFWLEVNDTTARSLLRSSFLYLPGVLLLLLIFARK